MDKKKTDTLMHNALTYIFKRKNRNLMIDDFMRWIKLFIQTKCKGV